MSRLMRVAHATEFGAMLKSWRLQRKTSQLELALRTEISQRHLSFIESGRAKPSAQMVMQLAEALEVPLRGRNALLLAAGFAPFYRERRLSDLEMTPVFDALARMLKHHDPYPAVVVDRDFNLLLQNQGFQALIALFGNPEQVWSQCCPGGIPNLLRLTFHPKGARLFIRNFEQVGSLMLMRAYRESLAHPDSTTHQFLAELRADTDIPMCWHTPGLQSEAPPVLPLILGNDEFEISLFAMISTFGTPHDVTTDEIRVESFFPANKESEEILRRALD